MYVFLAAARWSPSLIAVHGLLIAVSSLVVECRPQVLWLPSLRLQSSRVQAQ